MKKGITLLVTVFLLGGCASYRLEEAQTDLRSSFATHNFDQTTELLQKFNQKNVYKSKDEVLFDLEMATALHFSARYDSSSSYFSRAEEQMDELFTKSISQGIVAFLFGNDNTLAYNGESYEDIYLNAFKSLNYLHENDYEDALVEVRRMTYKLSQLETKYKGVAKALAKADTLGRGNWKTAPQSIHDSPLSHYLAAVMYAKSGQPDDARIEYEKLIDAIHHLPPSLQVNPDRPSLQKIKDRDAFNVLFVGFAGRAPIKYQNDVRLYLNEQDLYLKFSLPAMRLYNSRVSQVDAVIDDSLRVSLQLIEQMDAVAKEVYKVKEPIIYTRAFVRSLTKAIGTNAAGRAVKKKNKDIGFLVNLLGKVGQEFTEKADTRSWQTMPGQAYVQTAELSPGDHHARIEYRGGHGQLLYTRDTELHISSDKNLNLLESLYWN